MVNKLLAKFSLRRDREESDSIITNIENGVVFRGTNLWILIFAIFIASLGLNVNSTAVIIGAMLISPLMGPIMGLGLSVGINDLALFRKSFYNYLVATGVALTTSTIFFLLSPLNEAHSEILARTSPNIYDVLIALFGGLAGIVATASKQKGNVIPGVAIATALMPPLCTAGYGVATLKFDFFIGAFYLFVINTVFIALATFLTTRFLKLPFRHLPDEKADTKAQRIIWTVVILTIVPSIYFGYDLVRQDRFSKLASNFITAECNFKNDYLLNKKINAKDKVIELIYGGDVISEAEIKNVSRKLKNFGLEGTKLQIHQGFSYLSQGNNPDENNDQANQRSLLLQAKENELQSLKRSFDSLHAASDLTVQVYDELKAQYPELMEAVISPATLLQRDSSVYPVLFTYLDFSKPKSSAEKTKIENWLKIRFRRKASKVIFR